MTEAQIKLIVAAVVAVALFLAGGAVAWFWQANAYGNVIATNEANRQADMALIANAGADQARKALAKQQDAEQKLAALDKDAIEQKEKANAENESLRRAVADGTHRLRLAGSCSAGSGNVSQATKATGVGNAGSVELSRETGQAVLDLRRDLISDQAALRAAQTYIRDVCQ
jgi:prophage endopeptidase